MAYKKRSSGWFALVGCSLIFLFLAGCQVVQGQNDEVEVTPTDQVLDLFSLENIGVVNPTPTTHRPKYDSDPILIKHIDPLDLEFGEISVAGSTTVYPITEQMVNGFYDDGYVGLFHLSQSSTATSMNQFCAGDPIDIVNADRSLTSLLVNRCRAAGREPVIFQIGYDRLVYIVHRDNFWVDSIESDQLRSLFAAGNWIDFNPLYPDRPLNHHFPDLRQNSMRRMINEIYGTQAQNASEEFSNVVYYPNEVDLVTAVSKDVNGIGFVSNGSLVNFADGRIKIVQLDDLDHVTSINYPVQRGLYLVTDEETLKTRPDVTAFIAYYLNRVHTELPPLGYAPLSLNGANSVRDKFVNDVQELEEAAQGNSQISLQKSEE